MRLTRRGIAVVFGAAASVLAVVGSAAYACTNLSTINLSTGSARAGDTVTATGTSFGGGGCGCRPRGVSPVEIHWNGRTGPILGTAQADTAGSISATFTVPDAKPGMYTIVATQRDLELNMDYYGTPAMASIEVLGPNGESVVARSAETAGNTESSTSSSTMLALTVGLGLLSLGLFAGGAITGVRELARKKAPAAARVHKD